MGFGSWFKKLGKKIKQGFKDFANGFKHGWNKTKSVLEKVPVIGNVAKVIPKFNNKNNPVSQHFGGDGYITTNGARRFRARRLHHSTDT